MTSPNGILRPEQGRIQSDAYRRIAEGAKRPVGLDAARDVYEWPFSYPGAVAVAESGRYYPRGATRLASVHISLGTTGTSNTVIEIRKNGTALSSQAASTTITLGSGVRTATAAFGQTTDALTADLDYLTVAITTAGTGAKDLVEQARFA